MEGGDFFIVRKDIFFLYTLYKYDSYEKDSRIFRKMRRLLL